jgi:hypothetical protein
VASERTSYPRRVSADPIGKAMPTAARLLEARGHPGDELRENDLRNAVALALQLDGNHVITEGRLDLSDFWLSSGRLGGFDLCLVDAGGDIGRCAELKWCTDNKLHELLWDLLKAGPASTLAGIAGAYVVTGAREAQWTSSLCGDLLDDGEWDVEALLAERDDQWRLCLAGARHPRPRAITRLLEVVQVADEPIELPKHRWRLRAARVRSLGDDRVQFVDGLPAPV